MKFNTFCLIFILFLKIAWIKGKSNKTHEKGFCDNKEKHHLKHLGNFGPKSYFANTLACVSWYQAWEFCRTLGAVLISIESEMENEIISHLLKHNKLEEANFWTGGVDFERSSLAKDNKKYEFFWMGSGFDFTFEKMPKEGRPPRDPDSDSTCVFIRHVDKYWGYKDCFKEDNYALCERYTHRNYEKIEHNKIL